LPGVLVVIFALIAIGDALTGGYKARHINHS
jgi:hypothetical protein